MSQSFGNEAGWNLEAIGYDADFQAHLTALDPAFVPARIAIAHGESYLAWAARGSCKAVLPGRGTAGWQDAASRPQVGDWVAGTYSESAGDLLIEQVLERRTCLMRLAAGERPTTQIIAANVDVVGIVTAFADRKGDARRLINEPRLQRYLAVVAQSGAEAVLIVNKTDLSEDPGAVGDSLRGVFPGVPVVLTSGARTGGLDALAPWLRPRKTLGLIGMSGVGKSTLVNVLLGRAAQRTGEVRDSDARGRHTTTHRELVLMETGALLIDTPGMRELGLVEPQSLVGFEDVIALSGGCRFTNCRHATEPGCAVRSALESGSLSRDRWASYERLASRLDQGGAGRHPTPGGRGRAALRRGSR